MKIKALNRFRQKLAKDELLVGMFVTLESPCIVEMAVSLNFDWIVIDAEHGHLGWKEIAELNRATVRSETVALVRIAERNTALIKRVLDIGVDGILVPNVESVAEVEAAVADCRYPPEGRRGIGGERATVWGQCFAEHAAEANDHVLVVPMIESPVGAQNASDYCKVDGVDAIYFGPADFSANAGYRGQWEGPDVAEQILAAKDAIRAAGKQCGLIATSPENLVERQEQGFRMLGIGSDAKLLLQSIHEALAVVGRDRKPATSLDPQDSQPI